MAVPCGMCGCTETQYQSFSAGREYYCPQCDDTHLYPEGEAPRRVQMIADGKFDELRAEMRDELNRRAESKEN